MLKKTQHRRVRSENPKDWQAVGTATGEPLGPTKTPEHRALYCRENELDQ